MTLYRNPASPLTNGSLYARIGGSVKALTQLYCRAGGRNLPLFRQIRDGSMAMLYNSSYQNDEADNLRASLARLGKTGVLEFADISATSLESVLDSRQILLIPESETGDLFAALSAPARQQIINFVFGGGHLVTFYVTPSTLALLNLFALGATNSGVTSSAHGRNPSLASPFSSSRLPATLNNCNATQSLHFANSGIANSSQYLYLDSSGNPTVASFGFAAGRVSYLGWDWFGSTDGNWETVLQELLNA